MASGSSVEELGRRIARLERSRSAGSVPQLPRSSVSVNGEDLTLQQVADSVAGGNAWVGELSEDVRRENAAIHSELSQAQQDLDDAREFIDGTVTPGLIAAQGTADGAAAEALAAKNKAQSALDEAFAAQGGVAGALAAIATLDGRLVPEIESAQAKADDAAADALNALTAASNAVTGTYDEFAVSATAETAPTVGWSASSPPWAPGAFVWRRSVTTKGGGATTTGAPVLVTGNAGASGADAVVLRITSSAGSMFKNNVVATELSVTVFNGPQQIVNIDGLWAAFGYGAFLEWSWRRRDDSDFGLISASDSRLSRSGFALTVSPDDVDVQVVFQCELHT